MGGKRTFGAQSLLQVLTIAPDVCEPHHARQDDRRTEAPETGLIDIEKRNDGTGDQQNNAAHKADRVPIHRLLNPSRLDRTQSVLVSAMGGKRTSSLAANCKSKQQ